MTRELRDDDKRDRAHGENRGVLDRVRRCVASVSGVRERERRGCEDEGCECDELGDHDVHPFVS